jgi:glycerol-3-phosphate acyltransferase PlsY
MLMWLPLWGYALGSIPFAFLLARRWSHVDVRLVGSGNVGATNVLRTSGKSVGLLVALLDLAKGSAAVLLADRLGAGDSMRTATGVAAVVGHVYPVWLHFRGGKGVATAAGVFAMLTPVATGLAAVCFALTLAWSRYVSLASMVGVLLLGLFAYSMDAGPAVLVGIVVVTGIVMYRHRGNLARLRSGTECRIGQRRT